jgi:protein-S-isoprenylcysteine O-methyltransferase Ste14
LKVELTWREEHPPRVSSLVNYRRIPEEEQMMIDEFGEEYLEYMKRYGKLLPLFSRK